jgi:hypothetical protein
MSFGKKLGGTVVREGLCFFTGKSFAHADYESIDALLICRGKSVPAQRNPR